MKRNRKPHEHRPFVDVVPKEHPTFLKNRRTPPQTFRQPAMHRLPDFQRVRASNNERTCIGKMLNILIFLLEQPGMTAGLNTIASALGEDPKDLQAEHEAYLVRQRFVLVSKGGRRLGEKGYDYCIRLAETRRQQGSS